MQPINKHRQFVDIERSHQSLYLQLSPVNKKSLNGVSERPSRMMLHEYSAPNQDIVNSPMQQKRLNGNTEQKYFSGQGSYRRGERSLLNNVDINQ